MKSNFQTSYLKKKNINSSENNNQKPLIQRVMLKKTLANTFKSVNKKNTFTCGSYLIRYKI